METATKKTQYKSLKIGTGYANGLLVIGILFAALTITSNRSWGSAIDAAKVVTYSAPAGEIQSNESDNLERTFNVDVIM